MSRQNPYVGPRAFTTGEPLFGRGDERAALLDLLVAERVVVLHAPSGAGKSSLLFAGLIPDLRAEGFIVRPPIRVGTEPPASAGAINRFCFSAVLSLAEGEAHARPMAELGKMSLAAYLGDTPPEAEVLIFDQFEEVLTVDPVDRDSKQAFFADLAVALRCPQRWAVLAIREDHLAGLAPYQRMLPTRLKTTFRLDLLGVDAALSAMQEPARAVGVEFVDAAARKLVDDLRQVQVQTAEGGTAKVPGPYVEPVQLQVACRDLWERKPEDDDRIDERDVQEIGDVDQALTRYYDAQIALVAAETKMPEAELRRWVDRTLISEQGLRGQVLQGATQTAGLANAAVRRLVDTHLLRAEQRRGIVWFELAHDRLLGPVRASNASWADQHLSATQRQAQLWDSHGRPESLLLVDLAVIERQLAEPNMPALERSFLEASQVMCKRELEAKRLRRLVWWLVGVLGVGLLVTLGTLAVVYQLRSDAEMQRREDAEQRRADAERERDAAAAAEQTARQMGYDALSRQLAATVLLMPPERAELAALYAVAASQMGTGWDVRGCLANLVARAPELRALVPGKMMPRQLAHDPVHGVLAGLEDGGRVNLWDLRTRALIAAPRAGAGHEAVIFDASRGQFVTADRGDTATFYEPTTGLGRSLALGTGPWRRVAVSGDGARLATADAFGRVGVWDAELGAMRGLIEQRQLRDEQAIEVLALDAGGQTLALATLGGELRVWRLPGEKLVRVAVPAAPEGAPGGPPAALRFGVDGGVVGLLGDGRVLRFAVSAAGEPGPASVVASLGLDAVAQDRGQRTEFLGLGLAPDGARAVAVLCLDACTREVLRRWDGETGRVDATAVALPDRDMEARRFDVQVTRQVAFVAGARVAARVLGIEGWEVLPDSPIEVGALAVSRDDAMIAAGGCAADQPGCEASEVTVWRVADGSRVHARMPGLGEPPVALGFFAGDRRLAGFGRDGAVVLWDMSSGTVAQSSRLPSQPDALAIDARGDGLRVAISALGRVHLWDVLADGYVPVEFRGPTLPVQALAIDAAGSRLAAGGCLIGDGAADDRGVAPSAAGCRRGGIWLWALDSGAAIGEVMPAHDEAVVDLSFSPDGSKLLSVSADGTVLRFAAAGRLHDPGGLEDATIPVHSAIFTADGTALATIGAPRDDSAEVELRVWAGDPLVAVGAPTRQHSPLLREGRVRRRRVAFAGQATALVSASTDGVVVRNIGLEGLRRRACELAGRDMSATDWRRYLRDEAPPRPVCRGPLRPDID